MDTFYLTVVGRKSAAYLLRWLPWMAVLSVIASGCLGGRPSTVEIRAGPTLTTWDRDIVAPAGLSVTTFNVWGLPPWVNGASSDRYPRIARQLAGLGSDVVLLQEVWTRQCFNDLSEQARGAVRTWWTASARRKGGFLGQNGLLTLSRYPIEGGEIRHFREACLPDSLMNKGALKVTLTIGSHQRINVWNVHLQDGASGSVRSSQLAELVSWIKAARDGQIADIVGGDFNFTPESREFRQFAAAVGPSVHQLAGDVLFVTWDGLKPSPGAGRALDHIFVRMSRPVGEISAWRRRIFATSLPKDRLSDHMGVEAFLTFRCPEANGPSILAVRTASSTLPETSPFTSR